MLIVKVGGGKDIDWEAIAADVKSIGEEIIIVHGANYWMKEYSAKLNLEEKIITSPSGFTSRYTDSKTMEVLTMVYSGLINKRIVSVMQKHGADAIGLSGADGKIWQGKRKEAILSSENGKTKVISDSLTGTVEKINVSLLTKLVEMKYVPVITVPAITVKGELINVDNDRAVALMVRDLKIKTVVMLFEASGLLADPKRESSKIANLSKNDLDSYIKKTAGRMRKKMLGVKEAFNFGVETVYFGDGRVNKPISSALSGAGTTIK